MAGGGAWGQWVGQGAGLGHLHGVALETGSAQRLEIEREKELINKVIVYDVDTTWVTNKEEVIEEK